MKRSIIVGVEGQDGWYIESILRARGDEVLGVGRTAARAGDRPLGRVDIVDRESVGKLVSEWQPDEVYYLAACHESAENRGGEPETDLLRRSLETHVTGLANFLDALRGSSCAVVSAASCLMFGEAPDPQNEETPLRPGEIYAITKAAGFATARFFRERYGLRVSNAILFNHESPRRGPGYLSRRIVEGARAIARGEATELVLADLEAVGDWGWAPDYAEAMVRMAAHAPGDFIVATGRGHTVLQFVQAVFSAAGIDWRGRVRESGSLAQVRRGRLIGDSTRLRDATGWAPTLTFEEMAASLWEAAAQEERDRIPRDADLHPHAQ